MPPIAISMGDPVGIGPEVIFKAITNIHHHPGIGLFFHPQIIENPIYAPWLSKLNLSESIQPNHVTIINTAANQNLSQSEHHPDNAAIAYQSILDALEFCKKNPGTGLVTGPISKEGFLAADIPFTGHTTLLKDYFKSEHVHMGFESPKLRIVLSTIHVPLSDVESLLTPKRLRAAIDAAYAFALDRGIQAPRIGIAGLNPHAGEHGQFGRFEMDILIPTLKGYRIKSGKIHGPISPDVIFRQALNGAFDVVVALYHDQGLIPLKLLYFDSAVNVTLGLPIVRSSPDHGTAYDIAHKNLANADSMEAAIRYHLKETTDQTAS